MSGRRSKQIRKVARIRRLTPRGYRALKTRYARSPASQKHDLRVDWGGAK